MADQPSNLPKLTPVTGEQPTYAMMLPCSPENFSEFIIGLLGKSQVIESVVGGCFIIGRQEIENINALIAQRISQQNEASQISWSLTISYDDGSSVILDSYREFQEFAEAKRRIPLSCSLHFGYLIKFRERNAPEKQSIDVTFVSGVSRDEYFEYSRRRTRRPGFFIRIEHTARSWGVDIDSLITNHLTTLPQLKEGRLQKFLERQSTPIQFVLSFGFFLISMVGLLLQIDRLAQKQAMDTSAALQKISGSERLVEAIKITISQVTSGTIQKNVMLSLIFIVFFGIISITIAMSTDYAFKGSKNGILLLNQPAIDLYERIKRRPSGYIKEMIVTISISIVSGVVANYLFAWLASKT